MIHNGNNNERTDSKDTKAVQRLCQHQVTTNKDIFLSDVRNMTEEDEHSRCYSNRQTGRE